MRTWDHIITLHPRYWKAPKDLRVVIAAKAPLFGGCTWKAATGRTGQATKAPSKMSKQG